MRATVGDFVTIFCMIFQVLREYNIRKEELKARALALKILGKIFQVECFPKGTPHYVEFKVMTNLWRCPSSNF